MHGKAKEQAEIDGEKDIVDTSTIQTIEKNKYGNITISELEENLNNNAGNGKTEVIDNGDTLVVKFVDSGRYYEVDSDGNVESFEYENTLLYYMENNMINIGDYVEYNIGIGKNTDNGEYIMSSNETGYTSNQQFNVTSYDGKWQVLYNGSEGYGVQIISSENVLKNETSQVLLLRGKVGYNNIVKTLNTMAGYYINSKFAKNARSIGGLPTEIETSEGTDEIYTNDEYDYIERCASDLKVSDENYLYDITQAKKNSKITFSDTGCWMANRRISGSLSETYFRGGKATNADVKAEPGLFVRRKFS